MHRTPFYRAKSAYYSMGQRCLNKDGKHPTYASVELRMTLKEWLEWSLPRYEEFLVKYPNGSPSVSRRGDKGHYEFGNISVVSNKQNRAEKTARSGSLAREDGSKRCSKCKQIKTVEDFHRAQKMLDGLQVYCKPCNV